MDFSRYPYIIGIEVTEIKQRLDTIQEKIMIILTSEDKSKIEEVENEIYECLTKITLLIDIHSELKNGKEIDEYIEDKLMHLHDLVQARLGELFELKDEK